MPDLILRGGTVIDGTGRPAREGDVVVRAGRVARLLPPGGSREESGTVVDVSGLVVAPGFIDTHTHSDLAVIEDPGHEAKGLQGVTTSPGGPAREIVLGVRAEKISVEPAAAVGTGTLPAHVVVSEYLGAETVVSLRPGPRTGEAEQSTVGRHDVLHARIPGERHLTQGTECSMRLDLTDASFFDAGSGERLPVTVSEEAK